MKPKRVEHTITLRDVREVLGFFDDQQLYDAHRAALRTRKLSPGSRPVPYRILGAQSGAMHLFGDLIRGEVAKEDALPVSEGEFRTLLEQGELKKEFEEEALPTERFAALIGEARAAFDGPPDSERWSLLVETLDRCHPDDLERLLAYIEPQLNRWDTMNMERWEPRAGSYMTQFNDPDWGKGNPKGELRVAPPHWLLELFLGEHSPKHRLTRVVNLERLKVNWTVMQRLLKSPHLRQVTHFNVGDNAVASSQRFYKTLRTHELMRTVKALTLYGMTPDFVLHVAQLKGADHSFESLEEVHYRYNSREMLALVQQMAAYECFAGVTFHHRRMEARVNPSAFEYVL